MPTPALPAPVPAVPTIASNATTQGVSAAQGVAPPDVPAPQTVAGGKKSTDERAKEILAAFETEAMVGGEPETGTAAAPATSTAAAAATAPAAVPDAVAKARAERLERIAQMRAKEQQADQDRQARTARKELSTEADALRKKLADVEPLTQVFASEESLLAEAERRGMSAQKLVEWMRKRLTDPAAVAQQQAKTEVDKVREELAAERRAREALEQRLAERENQSQAQFAAQQKAQTFLQKTDASSQSHPLTSAFLKRHGAQAYVNYANSIVAPMLPEEYSVDELHDHFEQLLDELQLGAAGANTATASPANGESRPSPKKNGAAEPATTLSNALTAERASVAEEVPLHRLSRRERERLLKDQLARE